MKKVKGLLVIVFLVVTLVLMAVVAQPVCAAMTANPGIEDDLMAILERVAEFAAWVWAQFEIKFLVGHVLVNVAVAVAASIKTGDFKMHKLVEFLTKKLVPNVLLYAVFRIVGDVAGFKGLDKIIFGLIEVALWADLIENLGRLGVKLPEGIKRAVSKI